MKASRKSTSNGNQALIDAYFDAMIDEDKIESFIGICKFSYCEKAMSNKEINQIKKYCPYTLEYS